MDRMILTLQRTVEGERVSVERMLDVEASQRIMLGLGGAVELLHETMKQQLDELEKATKETKGTKAPGPAVAGRPQRENYE